MTVVTFTEAQAAHALDVVIRLIKERRFFLYKHYKKWSGDTDPDHTLDPLVFTPARELDEKISSAYVKARMVAETIIEKNESELGISFPDVEPGKHLVHCNRYTGGFDICRVYPLTTFLQYAPHSLEELHSECLRQALHEKTEHELTSEELREYKRDACIYAEKIWRELHTLRSDPQCEKKCVVLLKSRFKCLYPDGEDKDFMQGKVHDMQEFPHLLGYLFYRYSLQSRIVQHNFVVFDTSGRSHVHVEHWSGSPPRIKYDCHGGYACCVFFVTIQ